MFNKEFIEKYGDVLVSFTSYSKYLFTFTGELPSGETIMVYVGGSGENIYSIEVTNTPIKISELEDVDYCILCKNGKTLLTTY